MNSLWQRPMNLAWLFAAFALWGSPERGAAEEDKPKSDQPAFVYKVEHQVMAKMVGVDVNGICQAKQGGAIKSWRLTGFPAQIEHFSSCMTISSAQARGDHDFIMYIVAPDGTKLRSVEGSIDLGNSGKFSLIVDWDDVEVQEPGLYQMVLFMEGQERAKFPMRFEKVGSANPKKK
jgi:hypothetical protein